MSSPEVEDDDDDDDDVSGSVSWWWWWARGWKIRAPGCGCWAMGSGIFAALALVDEGFQEVVLALRSS